MANTIRTYTGDGVTTLYPIDFELGYLRREFVYVYTGEDFNTQLTYSWVSDSQIELSEPVPSGTEFYIRRIIPRNELINDYEDRAIFKKKNLNDSHRQHLMIVEELADGFLNADGTFSTTGDIDLNGFKITNLGEPEDDSDATTRKFVTDLLADVSAQAVTPIEVARKIGDGVTTDFLVPNEGNSSAVSYMVFLDGVRQRPNIDFIVTGTTLTFVEEPAVNVTIDITYFEPQILLDKSEIKVFDTVNDMLLGEVAVGDKIQTLGYSEVNDGGGSEFVAVPITDATPSIESGVFQSNSDPNIALKQLRVGSIDVEIPADFPTLQSAINYYMSIDAYADYFIDLWIANGHLLEGGVGCYHGDYSRFRIRSRDNAVVKLSNTFTPPNTGGVPASALGEAPREPFLIAYDAKAPQLWATIDMENNPNLGTGLQLAEAEMFVASGYGVINAGFRGIQVHGRANIYGANFSGAAGSGIRLQQASSCSARNAVADNCCKTEEQNSSAIYVSRSSTLEFRGGSAINSGGSGLIARRSIVTADEAKFDGAGDKGVEAESCSQVSFANGSALSCTSSAIRVDAAANVYAVGATLSVISGADAISVNNGACITIAGATTVGGVALTENNITTYSNVRYVNTPDSNGIVFFAGNSANGTFKVTSNSNGISQRFADGRMLTFINTTIDTGTVSSGNFSNQLTMPTQPDTFNTVDGSSMMVIGRTSAGGGGSRVCVDNYYRAGVMTGNAWRIRNTGQQLDGTGTGFNCASVNVSMITYGTWK